MPADTGYFIAEAVLYGAQPKSHVALVIEAADAGGIRQAHIAKNLPLPRKSKPCRTGGIRQTYDMKGSSVALKIQAVAYGGYSTGPPVPLSP